MKIIKSEDFYAYWKKVAKKTDNEATEKVVKKIIADVRSGQDAAVRKYASKFDKSSPVKLEVSLLEAKKALDELTGSNPALTEAMKLSASHIKRFAEKQKEQFTDFDYEMESGLITGQRVIPVQRAAIYIPAGRFPLFSSVLMGMIPAFCAGVEEVILSSPPMADGLPDSKILAAAAIAAQVAGAQDYRFRIFAMGGVQAIAALALGTETVPRVDVIAGPGSKYTTTAKRVLFGEVGIDFLAGPTDVLIIADGQTDKGGGMDKAADTIAADMLGQAEHDVDARARVLVPKRDFAEKINAVVERKITALPTKKIARSSLNAGGLIIIYQNMEEAVRIANIIAPEHLELQTIDTEKWIPSLKNFGSLFINPLSAEVIGDYSAGINHTLPTGTSSRFTGGLSVRHFLKTVTTLKCAEGEGFDKAREAAEILARAEGLEGHAQSAAVRR